MIFSLLIGTFSISISNPLSGLQRSISYGPTSGDILSGIKRPRRFEFGLDAAHGSREGLNSGQTDTGKFRVGLGFHQTGGMRVGAKARCVSSLCQGFVMFSLFQAAALTAALGVYPAFFLQNAGSGALLLIVESTASDDA
jgi:hypothetical protein